MKKIGDKVYYAKIGRKLKHVPCNVCFGQKFITCILGNGEKVTVECVGCKKGYLGSVGYQEEYEYEQEVILTTINKIDITREGIEYYTECGCGKDRCFDNEDEAISKAQELMEAHNKIQISKKEDLSKDWTWHVYYHRTEMKKAKKSFSYHKEKLDIAKEMEKNTLERNIE